MPAKKDFSQQALSTVERITGDGPLIDTPEKRRVQISTLPNAWPIKPAPGTAGVVKAIGKTEADDTLKIHEDRSR